MKTLSSQKIVLDFPIPTSEKGKHITQVIMRRPTTRDVADLVLLIGGKEISGLIKNLLETEGEITAEKLKNSKMLDQLFDNLAGLIRADVMDDFFALLARICAIETGQVEQLSPEDTTRILGRYPVFFPFSSCRSLPLANNTC